MSLVKSCGSGLMAGLSPLVAITLRKAYSSLILILFITIMPSIIIVVNILHFINTRSGSTLTNWLKSQCSLQV